MNFLIRIHPLVQEENIGQDEHLIDDQSDIFMLTGPLPFNITLQL